MLGRQELVALELDDLATPGVDLHLDLVTARIIAFDLPETVIELDLLDLHDPLVEGHLANVLNVHWPGEAGWASARLNATKMRVTRIEGTFGLGYRHRSPKHGQRRFAAHRCLSS
jgi:hypothetical protein